MSPKVYAPNVHLFAFHLRKSPNGNHADDTDKHWLWQSCNKIIRQILQQKLDLIEWLNLAKEPDNPTVCLIKDEKQLDVVPIGGKIYLDKNSPLLIEGFAYPLRLYDSDGLWLNLCRPVTENNQPSEDVDIQIFSKLNPNNCLLLGENDKFLGQTLIITAWLSSEHDPQDQKALKTLADQCLEAFFPNNYPLPPFARSATLFGSPIFEYGLFSQLTNYRHILVWFFNTDLKTEKKFESYQGQLFDLFFFRAKVVKAFQKSREVYEDTNKEYQKIEAEINALKEFDNKGLLNQEKLDALSEKLKTLPNMALDYANLLRYLESYQNTIAINGRNYADRLQQIRGIIKDEDISFLEQFSLENSLDFQEQIKAELGYFTHGSSLLDKAIASIRGRVEIDRAKSDRLAEEKKETSDRNLQITILAVGTGIGAGGIMASSYTLVQDDPILKALPYPVFNRLTASITYSLLFGFAVGMLILLGDRLWQYYKRKRT